MGAVVLGGIAGAAVLYFIASGQDGFQAGGFASNGFGEHSPGGFDLLSVAIIEIVITAVFVLSDRIARAGVGGGSSSAEEASTTRAPESTATRWTGCSSI